MTAGPTALVRTAPRRAAVAAAWAVVPLLVLANGLVHADRETGAILAGAGLSVLELLGLVLSGRLAFDRRLPLPIRHAWRWIAMAFVTHLLVGACYVTASTETGPAADRWILAAYGVRIVLSVSLLAAACTLRRPGRARHEWGLLVDTLMVAGSALLTGWYFVVGPAISRGFSSTADVLALVIPLADVIFLAGSAYMLIRGVVDGAGRTLAILTAAVAFLTVADLFIAGRAVDGHMIPTTGPMLGMVMAGVYLMVLACVQQIVAAPRLAEGGIIERSGGSGRWVTFLPYLAVLLGYVLLLVAAARSPFYPWGGLAVGIIVMTGGVVVRQVLQLRESQRLAAVDHITGLSNRAALRQGLDRVQERVRRTGRPAAVMLFDLDGFKAVNDTLGHSAGDEALACFGAVLRRNVLGTDLVARMGGDEFAVVLTEVRGPQDAVVVAERILADLVEPVILAGTPRQLRTSVGIALATGLDAPRGVLHQADLAMYEAKRGSGSAWRVYVSDEVDKEACGPAALEP
jgi:diguanylate cyclase (GGDEF)-like protein